MRTAAIDGGFVVSKSTNNHKPHVSWHRQMELRPSLETLDQLDVDALAIGLCTDLKPPHGVLSFLDWRLCGSISDLITSGAITGQTDESILLATQGRIAARRVFLFGWGERKFLANTCQTNLHRMLAELKRAKVDSCALAVPDNCDEAMKAVHHLTSKILPVQLVGIFKHEAQFKAVR